VLQDGFVEDERIASYESLYEGFVAERRLEHDPALWADSEIALWRRRYAEWALTQRK
jgi:hypothetical protein